MTEQEFIDATNLAKIIAARTIVDDALAMNDTEARWQDEAICALTRWMVHLQGSVILDPKPGALRK